jgi:hypothetical protein
MGLSFKTVAGPRQRSHSRLRVPQDSWPHFIVSDSRLPQPGGLGTRICIPQDQDVPVIPPDAGFCFRRLLQLAGLRWRHSNPRAHGRPFSSCLRSSLYSLGEDPQKTPSLNVSSIVGLCRGNVFTEQLLFGHLLWFHYSGFRASCQSIIRAYVVSCVLPLVPLF